MSVESVVAWLAPILSTIIVTAATASINAQVKRHELIAEERHGETEAKRKAEKEWQDSVIERLDEQDKSIGVVMSAQCSQIRSDIIHKCHRYLDDLGKASTEEKQALHEEYDDYQSLCEQAKVENHFVDSLVARVMELPEREV